MRTGTWLTLAVIIAVLAGVAWFLLRPKPETPVPIQVPDPGPKLTVSTILPEEAKRRMESGEKYVLLDVRTPEEYAKWRIPGSLLIPIDKPEIFGPAVAKAIPDRDTAIFAFCRSGRRSHTAAEILMGIGYHDVYNLGGIIDWTYETEEGP